MLGQRQGNDLLRRHAVVWKQRVEQIGDRTSGEELGDGGGLALPHLKQFARGVKGVDLVRRTEAPYTPKRKASTRRKI